MTTDNDAVKSCHRINPVTAWTRSHSMNTERALSGEELTQNGHRYGGEELTQTWR